MSYLRILGLTVLLCLTLVGTINWLIDPYGMYWSPQFEGINTKKVRAGNRVRSIKPVRVKQVNPQTVLIGNSRIEMGMSALSKQFTAQPVYNLGMPGIGLSLQAKLAMDQLRNNANLRTMLLSVDYLDFLFSPESLRKSGEAQLLPETVENWWPDMKQRVHDYLSLLLSLDTLSSSIQTVALQRSDSNHIGKFGTNIADGYLSIIRSEGLDVLFRQKINEVSSRLASSGQILYSENLSENPGFSWLKTIIEEARARQINLVIFTNPYHYSYLQLIHESGQWDQFEDWKRGLARLSENGITILDFSGFNRYSLEEANLTDNHQKMQWYWEPSHYNASLGELMLTVMLSPQQQKQFGRKLNIENIDRILTEDKNGVKSSKDAYFTLLNNLSSD